MGTRFTTFLNRINAAPLDQRPAVADSFMATITSFPFVEDDSCVAFIYRGSMSKVNVPGDFNGWDPNAYPMIRIQGTNFWYWQEIFEPDARLDYKFVLNANNWILDPKNPKKVSGGFGPNSELAMPDYVQPPEIQYFPAIPHGMFHDTTFYSTLLKNTRKVKVYTPPGYQSTSQDSFPLVLLHDGSEYITLAQANNVLDYLIAENRIQPLIAVFVPPVNRNEEYAFSQRDAFESFIIDELMPAMDARYRIRRNPAYRAMIGVSFGGLISTQICYHHPEAFGLCGPYSPAYWPENMLVYHEVLQGPAKNISYYIDWGTYEPGIPEQARVLRDALLARANQVRWNEWHEGHSWGSWRAHLDEALLFFFPKECVGITDGDKTSHQFRLLQNYPNPFNSTTLITFELSIASHVDLRIYNVLGQEVKSVVNMFQSAGVQSVSWDGRDQQDHLVDSGLYFYRLKTNDRIENRRMIYLK